MKEDDTNSDAESVESSSSSPRRKRSQFLTGRGVTLRMLMEDGIVEAGEGVLSIDYLVRVAHSLFLRQKLPGEFLRNIPWCQGHFFLSKMMRSEMSMRSFYLSSFLQC